MKTGQYFFDDGNSRKFWSYTQSGKKQTTRHGRIGSEGRETKKTFPSPAAAEADTEKLISQKVKKGYVPIDSSNLKLTRPKGKRKATESQVNKLEQQLGAELPTDYRQFLLTENGGEPDPFFVKIPGHPYIDNVSVGYIHGLYAKDDSYGLLAAIDQSMPCLPKGHLPIAGDSDLFSISLIKKPGCVYFWDHEAVQCEDEDEEGNYQFKMSHATLLAGSFNEFLTRISRYGMDT